MKITKADTGESFQTPDAQIQEYLRRNIIVCKAFGVEAGISSALARIRSMKRPPKWLAELLRIERAKAFTVAQEMAIYRDQVKP